MQTPLDQNLEDVKAQRDHCHQRYLDADFNGDTRMTEVWRQQYLMYKRLHDKGVLYNPKF